MIKTCVSSRPMWWTRRVSSSLMPGRGFTSSWNARQGYAGVAMGDATADHSVIPDKNSARPPMEAQPLVQFPHQMHAPGERVKCTYIEIPQVGETYENIGSKIWWAFGYEQGINEY